MIPRPNGQSVYRRNSQRAPFPGSGAKVQNAALSNALTAERPPAAGGIPETPRVVSEPATNAGASAGAPPPAPVTQPPPPTPPASPYAGKWGYESIKNAYKEYLGREASDAEILAQLNGGAWAGDYNEQTGGSVTSSIQSIYNSPEAMAYRNSQPKEETSTTTEGDGTTAPPDGTPPPSTGTAPGSTRAFTPGSAGSFTGYDAGKMASGTRSLKYDIGAIVSKYPPTADGLRAAYEEIKASYPQVTLMDHPTDPKLNFNGMLSDFEGGVPVFEVDLIRGGGAPGSMWQWLDERNDAPAGGGVPPPGGGGSPPPSPAPSNAIASMNTQDPEFVQKLLAYLMSQLSIGDSAQGGV